MQDLKFEIQNHRAGLGQAIGAGGEEFEEVQVTQDLELLADFVADVAVTGMETKELTLKSINLVKCKFVFPQRTDYIQHIKSPATFFDTDVSKGSEPTKTFADFRRGASCTIDHDWDTSVDGNAVEQDIAANPSRTAGVPA